jgi:hypothetical protein
VRHVACTIGEEKLVLGSGAVNVKVRDGLEDLRLDGRVIQKYVVEETRMESLNWRLWISYNELSGSVKYLLTS